MTVNNDIFTKGDRLQSQAKELRDQAYAIEKEARARASAIEKEARARANELYKQVAALDEAAMTDADREREELEEKHGHQCFVESIKGIGNRIKVGNRSAVVSGTCGCCLDRFYNLVHDASYAPQDGDQMQCSKLCMTSGLGSEFIYFDGKWQPQSTRWFRLVDQNTGAEIPLNTRREMVQRNEPTEVVVVRGFEPERTPKTLYPGLVWVERGGKIYRVKPAAICVKIEKLEKRADRPAPVLTIVDGGEAQ